MNKITFNQENFNFIYDHFDHLADRYYIYQNGLNVENPAETVNIKRKYSYLECLTKTIDAFVLGKELEIEPELQHEVDKELKEIEEYFNKYTVNSEEIRQAILLLVIKGFKNEPLPLDCITPDVIGLILTNIIDSMFKDELNIRLLDPMAGSGNMIYTINNYSKLDFDITFEENNGVLCDLLRSVSNLLDLNSTIYLQDALQYNLNNNDLLVCDIDSKANVSCKYESLLYEKGIRYFPYLLIEKYLSSEENIKKQIYVTDCDFFNYDENQEFKKFITKVAHIDYIITLPLDLFKESNKQKQILIISDQIDKVTDTVIFMLPNIRDPKFKDVLTEIKKNIEERY